MIDHHFTYYLANIIEIDQVNRTMNWGDLSDKSFCKVVPNAWN